MLRSKVIRQIARGLAQDLEMMDNPDLDELVVVKSFPATRGVSLHSLDRFENVAK